MKSRGPLLIVCVFLFASACGRPAGKGIDVRISNQSGASISDVRIATSEKLDSVVFDKVEDGEQKASRLSMSTAKTDGSYLMRFVLRGKVKELSSGYYTNGASMDRAVSYVVKSDTVMVKFDSNY